MNIAEIKSKFKFDGKNVTFEVVEVEGVLKSVRDIGKSIFAEVDDGTSTMQIYVHKDIVTEDCYDKCKHLLIDDTIKATGILFITKTDLESKELTLKVGHLETIKKIIKNEL